MVDKKTNMARKSNSTYTLLGRITLQGGSPEGLTIYAFDQDPNTPENPLGQRATTDSNGDYSIAFHGEDFRIGGVESGGPDVFIRVFDGDEQIGESPIKRNSKKRITINLELTYIRVNPDEPVHRIFGVVRDIDDNVLPGITVSAFEKHLRSDERRGEPALSDSLGQYEIRYTTKAVRPTENGKVHSVVKAFAADGAPLFTSPVRVNVPESAEWNLTIPAEKILPPTLFEKITRVLIPLLEGLQVEDLEEYEEQQDLSFLARETGFEKKVLARFVMAHKLVRQGIQAEFWFVLLGGSFYEYTENQSLMEQLTSVFHTLPSLNDFALRKALARGFNEKDIPANLRANTDEWIEAFLGLIARRSVSETDTPTLVKLALDHAGIEGAEKQGRFARLFNEYRALTPELIAALEQDKSFNNEEIADVRTSFRLAELTNGDFSVVKMLKDEFDIRQPENIRALAKRSESEWVSWAREKYVTGDIKLPIEMSEISGQIELSEAEIYGKTLEHQFREAFPTAAFAGGLERALKNGGAHGLHDPETLYRFFDIYENFEFLNDSIDDFLDNNTHPEFRAENFRQEAKAVGRVFKFAPTFEATDTLLADNLHSGQQIYRMGENEFVERYADSPGFTADTARIAWNRAADTYAAVLTVVGDFLAFENQAQPAALKSSKDALSSFPNWNNLFQTGDLCDCEQCRSVLGPAAYFADLLVFLRDRDVDNNPDTKISVKDVLFRRRPDLGYLELNCDNAKIQLPYIDVVCEVLENAVDATHENDLELMFTLPAPGATLETAVRKLFKDAFAALSNIGKEKIELGDNISLSQVNSDEAVLHSDNVTYLLRKNTPDTSFSAEILRNATVSPVQRRNAPDTSFSAEILPNTKASAAELRAYPQYVNPKAYTKLQAAKYPITLPFDLYAEEVKAAFQKTNLKRWELMRAFRGANGPNNPTDGDIAAEYFGISAGNPAFDEKSLIFEAKPNDDDQKIIWGEAGYNWLDKVSNVKTFLQKTGLEYTELLTLLDLEFIKQEGTIEIVHADDPACDTDEKTLQTLNAEKLDLIHRFLRLWRKLKGWKMWELDLVICQLGANSDGKGVADEQFLITLFYFSEVRNKLDSKTTVEQTLALFGNLNTKTHFTKLHEKRADGLYQSLFLNKKLIHPLDNAFAVTNVNLAAPPVDKISALQSVVVAALGIPETDLGLLKGLIKASDGLTYIADDLTLTNLSFLWRHTWLSKLLKFKAQEWKALLKILDQDILKFASPKAALEFLENVDHLKASGFTVDEINWLLTADRSAKSAPKEADASRFLLVLRKQLQAIKAEYNPTKYPFLTETPPTDTDSLTTLLTSLLQKLNRSDAEADVFVKILRGSVLLEAPMQVLPLGVAFGIPTTITSTPNNIPIRFDQTMRFNGVMTAAQREILLNDTTLNGGVVLEVTVQGLPSIFAFPPEVTGTNPTDFNIPIQRLTMAGKQIFRFTGVMSAEQRTTLLDDSIMPPLLLVPAYTTAIEALYQQSLSVTTTYQNAIEDLYQQSLAAATDYVLTEVDVVLAGGLTLPADLPSTPIRYDAVTNTLSFAGVMSLGEQGALKAVNTASAARGAIDELFRLPRLAVKFYEPVFTSALETLPPQVNFQASYPPPWLPESLTMLSGDRCASAVF